MRDNKNFNLLKYFVMFVGYPRSGHSLYGCLLDAHPDITIAQEANILRLFWAKKFNDRFSLFENLIKNSNDHLKDNKKWQGYSYFVPRWFQGKCNRKTIKIIGDKKGGDSTILLMNKGFDILKDFQKFVEIPVKYIHVIRNPFDNIATLSRRHFKGDLNKSISYYLELSKTVCKLKESNLDILDIRHEDFVTNPEEGLKNICDFLEIGVNAKYIEDCSSIIFKKPSVTRNTVEWTDEKIDIVQSFCNEIDFLKNYSY